MGWQSDFLDWLEAYHSKHGAYPEDQVLRWIYRHPFSALGVLFAFISGLPFLGGVALGAVFF